MSTPGSEQYIPALREFLREVFWESWMDSDDWKCFEEALFGETASSYEDMAERIAQGVANGYSLEKQLEIMRKIYNEEKQNRP